MKRILPFLLLLVSCSTSKKSVSINKSHVDSAIVTHTEAVRVVKIDSSARNKKVDSGQRVTDIIYTPFVVDTSDYVEVPVNSVVVRHGAKKTIFVPHTLVIENGTSTQTNTAKAHKTDSSNVVADVQAHVVTGSKIIEKRKSHFGFSMWWLLILLLAPLLSPKVRAFIRHIFIPL